MDQTQAAALVAAGAVQTTDAGRPCLNLPIAFPFSQVLAASTSRLDLSQTVDGDADFFWRGWKYIDIGAGFNLWVRLGLLSGYYLSNVPFPVAQTTLRTVTPELRVPAGGLIQIEAINHDSGNSWN